LREEIRIDREKQIRLDRNQEGDRIRERDGNVSRQLWRNIVMKSNWIQKWCLSESSLGTLTTKSMNQQTVSVGTLKSSYSNGGLVEHVYLDKLFEN